MSGRNGRYRAAFGGLAAIFLAAAAPPGQPQGQPKAAPAGAQPNSDRSERPSAYERESLAVDRAANGIAERANRIAGDQRAYAFWQLILGVFGVAFTGVAAFFAWRATHWAKEAASAARQSARADNEALSETRKAAEAARTDAVAQAAQFDKQMGSSHQLVEWTAKTAYEMGHAATAMRYNAAVAAKQTEIAEITAKRRLQAYVQVQRGNVNWFNEGVEIVLTIKNSGSTPATFFEIFGIVEFVEMRVSADDLIIPNNGKSLQWSSIAGGEETTAPLRQKELSLSNLRRDQSNFLSARGRVRYGTIFGETHFSEFSLMLKYRPADFQKMQQTTGRLQVYKMEGDQNS